MKFVYILQDFNLVKTIFKYKYYRIGWGQAINYVHKYAEMPIVMCWCKANIR